MTTPTVTSQTSGEPKTLTKGFRLLLICSALYIAGCSAYFSVIGLGQLFIGSNIAVMIMAASLEVGKLVAASFLYRYWDLINATIRFYLIVAVLALIGITSLGNYGFLARAYEKTQVQIAVNEAQIINLEKEIPELQKQIEDSKNRNTRVNSGSREDITKAQEHLAQGIDSLNQSLARLQEQRKNLNERRAAEVAAPTQRASDQNDVFKKAIAAEEATINGLNERIRILDQAVDTYTKQGSTSFLGTGFFEKDGVKKGQELREEQKEERSQIAAKLTETSNRIEKFRGDQAKMNSDASQEGFALRDHFNKEIQRLDSEEKDLRRAGNAYIAELEKELRDLQNSGQGKVNLSESETDKLFAGIRAKNDEIHNLREQIATTDIGSYRFVARAFDAEATDIVKWLMLIIVAVFDPLAVTLVVAFNMAVTKGDPTAAGYQHNPAAANNGKHRAGKWSHVEIVIVGIIIAVLLVVLSFFFNTNKSGNQARQQENSTKLIPGNCFSVVTFRPDDLRQKSNQAFPAWLERVGGKGMSAAVAALVKNGLDPHSEIYAFIKFPNNRPKTSSAEHPSMIGGLVVRVTDATTAEAALSRIADQVNNTIRGETGKFASQLTRSRSMIRHGEGRYMDPEGGFFTFGLTNRTAIILVEFEGNTQAPCVENEIRACLTSPPRFPKPDEKKEFIPPYAFTEPGALTLWLDANRFYRQLPMSGETRARYEKLRTALDFELVLGLQTTGVDALNLNGTYIYQFDRFAVGSPVEPVKIAGETKTPANIDAGWKLINRSMDTLDYDSMVERMRGALSDDKTPGAQQVHVIKQVNTARDARFFMTAKFDPKAGPPLVTALQIFAN